MSTLTTPTRSTAEAIALCSESFRIMESGTFADFERIVHPQAVNREANDEPPECREPGPAGFYATALWLRAAFAELSFEIHEAVADGDLVVVHNTMSGRQAATMVEYLPDGSVGNAFPSRRRTFASTQTHWFRIADGQIIEHWANRDDIATAVQLGWVPPSPWYLLRMGRAKRKARTALRRTS
jgi:predicted ester cyclase